MQAFMARITNKYGYWGVAILAFIDQIMPFLPSPLINSFFGLMVLTGDISPYLILLIAVIFEDLGCLIYYLIGMKTSKNSLNKFLKTKVAHRIGMDQEKFQMAMTWFNQKGKFAVLISRLIPMIRSFISIPAGIARMEMAPFLLYSSIGNAIWALFFMLIGMGATKIINLILNNKLLFGLILVVLILGGIFIYKNRSSINIKNPFKDKFKKKLK